MNARTLTQVLLWATFAAMAYQIYFIFMVTPAAQEAAGGLAQKIFYFHVPSAYAMYLSGAVCFVGSVAYLMKASDRRDAWARAGAECAVVFGCLILTSGPLWAKKAWGVYWTWEPRLVSLLLGVILYIALVILRTFTGDGLAERKMAAALGILGTANLPIIHYAVQKWGGVHPQVVTGEGGGLQHPAMTQALLMGFFVMTLLAALLIVLRVNAAMAKARLTALEQRAGALGLLEDA